MNIREFINVNKKEIPKFTAENILNREMEAVMKIFDQIASDCRGNKMLEDYFQKMIDGCYNYTAIVCEFERLFEAKNNGEIDLEEFQEKFDEVDKRRHFVHNSTMDSFNILSRLMLKEGKNNDWIKPLVSGGRSAYGNLAISKTIIDVIAQENLNNQEKGDNYGTDSKE